MGRLIVESITVVDFLSWREGVLDLNGSGPVAVIGENGAGKSSLVSKALSWALYGRTAPERMGSGTRAMSGRLVLRRRDSPLRKQTPKPKAAKVVVALRDDDGTSYYVTRERKASGGDKIAVRVQSVDGGYDDVDGSDQAYIDRLVGADYEVFVRTCLRGQGDPWNFLEATDKRKREILDVVSGSLRLQIPYERAQELRKSHANQADTFQQRVDDARRRVGDVNVDDVKVKAAQWVGEHQQRLRDADAELANLQRALEDAKSVDASQQQLEVRRVEVQARRPAVDFAPYESAINEARSALTKAQAKAQQLEAEWARLDALKIGAPCPTCHTPITEQTPVQQVKRDLVGPIAEAREHAAATEAHFQECLERRAGAQQWLQKATDEWQNELNSLPTPGPRQTPAAEKAVALAVRRRSDLESAQNPWTEAINQAEGTRQALEREAVVLEEEQREAERIAWVAGAWEEVLGPKGVRAHLAEGAMAAIESEANRWLTVLSDGMSIRFHATRQTQAGAVREEIVTEVTKNGEEQDLLAFSGGEKRRLNLAVDLAVATAFSRSSTLAVSLLVLDEEVFSGLDEAGKASVSRAFHASGVADIVVVDHDPRLAAALPRSVRVVIGEDGYSRIEV